MCVPWYERETIRKKLIVFGRAMQGVSPYSVHIVPDSHRCAGGYCSFTTKRIAVNPIFFAGSAREQYQLTKALLVHEAGHRRYTTPKTMPAIINQVSNVLEDERVERRMCEEFPAVTAMMHTLSKRFYERAKPINDTTDSPGEVVFYFLQLRWVERIGCSVKGGLSPKNQLRWQRILPLVHESWDAETSEVVNRNAEKIAEILGFNRLMVPGGSVEYLIKH